MASFIQNIQGLKITLSPALKASGLFSGPTLWPRGYAFGGWVYNSNLKLGFSKNPTELTLSIVLEASDPKNTNPNLQKFDISDFLLSKSLTANGAVGYGDEYNRGHWYDIDLHGVRLKRMFLYDYSISIESNQKVLTVTFKDYSLILNKIYIGLIKRQGPYGRNGGGVNSTVSPLGAAIDESSLKESVTKVNLEAYCPNCYLLGRDNLGAAGTNLTSFFNVETGYIIRKLHLGSYAVKYSDSIDDEVNSRNLTSLRYFDPNDPDILEDKACYNARGSDIDALCGSLYPPVLFGHRHPRRRLGLHWAPPEYRICIGNPDVTEEDACCTDGGGSWNGVTKECSGGTNRWKATRNLTPKDFYSDLSRRLRGAYTGVPEFHAKGFTIDGGYVMLGTEEFSTSRCGDLPNITYNFTELIDTLKFHGLSIANHTDMGAYGLSIPVDKNPKFRANYIGTAREVLEQWCGAMSLDFYWDNETEQLRFIDLEQGADIAPIEDVVDPSTAVGSEFGATSNGKTVVISYKESSSLENTFLQRVITSNTKPFRKKEKVKDVQRYVPMLPLHPLDFTAPNQSLTNYETVYGEAFTSRRYANIMPWTSDLKPWRRSDGATFFSWAEPNIPDWHEARKRIWYTQRQLWDIDYAIALAKYNKTLRDIYVGQRIVDNCKSRRVGLIYDTDGSVKGHRAGSVAKEVDKDFKGNCAALGFEPLAEVIDHQVKTELIAHFMGGGNSDVRDINRDQKFHKIFIGYYSEPTREDVVTWEGRCAEAMYKHGAVVQGTLPFYPYVPFEFYGIKDGEAGYNTPNGLSIPKLEHSFSPSADTYAQCSTCLEMFDAPFNDVLIRSGNFLPTGLRFATLDNPWGTNAEGFEIEFNKAFRDNGCEKYNSSYSIEEEMDPDLINYHQTQSWKLEDFAPQFFDDLSDAWVDLQDEFEAIQANAVNRGIGKIDEVSVGSVDINTKFRTECRKIHLMIITDVANGHPNIDFQVRATRGSRNPMAQKARELWEIKEHQRKAKEEFRDMCDRDINYEFCENAMTANARDELLYGSTFLAQNMASCAISPTGVYKEGFDKNIIGGFTVRTPFGIFPHFGTINSRALNIRLIRNPAIDVDYPDTDDMGFYYLSDLEEDLEALPTKVFNYNIIYPTNNYKMYGAYGWYPGAEPYTEPVPYNNTDPLLAVIYGPGTTYWPPMQSPFYPGGLGNKVLGQGNFQCYSGIWNAKVTVEDRIPEMAEIYGTPIGNDSNPTAGMKVINNSIDPDLEAMLDPNTNEFITRIFDSDGDALATVLEWHNFIANGDGRRKGLNQYGVIQPTKQIDLQIAGSVKEFPSFHAAGFAHPSYGLNSYSISLAENGLKTDMSFASRPPQAPSEEAILNKIGPRLM